MDNSEWTYVILHIQFHRSKFVYSASKRVIAFYECILWCTTLVRCTGLAFLLFLFLIFLTSPICYDWRFAQYFCQSLMWKVNSYISLHAYKDLESMNFYLFLLIGGCNSDAFFIEYNFLLDGNFINLLRNIWLEHCSPICSASNVN